MSLTRQSLAQRYPHLARRPAGSTGKPLIAVVGICAAGKTTLVNGLRKLGYEAVSIAQEHSNVPYLWTLKKPSFLVMLEASYETVRKRRRISYGPERLDEQRRRLRHARQYCDFFLETDRHSIDEVRTLVVAAFDAAQN